MMFFSPGAMLNGLSLTTTGVREEMWPRASTALVSVSGSELNQYVLVALRIFSPNRLYLMVRSSSSISIGVPGGNSEFASAPSDGLLIHVRRYFSPTQAPMSASSTPGM